MSEDLVSRIRAAIEAELASFGPEPPASVSLEVPPRPEFGDLACPVAFELARRLKRSPRDIAQQIQARIGDVPGVERAEVAGGGYINIFFDRDLFLRTLAREIDADRPKSAAGKRIVEHTNINPNKAAHIGHFRNAVLGDTLVRCLRFLGEAVEVQNYIDDTGVQVADLTVGFREIRGLGLEAVREIAEKCARHEEWSQPTRHFVQAEEGERGGQFEVIEDEFARGYQFDHYCWDLYAEVGPYYAASEENAARRAVALKGMEERRGEYAELAEFLSRRMVLHHLRTMRRLDVHYDLLPHESDILALGFWERTFTKLKESGAIRFSSEGKTNGCWVMDLPEAADAEDEGAKIIVRSNGTVTYVGKDIAYQLWKFGLLGKDFLYEPLYQRGLPAYSSLELPIHDGSGSGKPGPVQTAEVAGFGAHTAKVVWRTCSSGGIGDHPAFGGAERVYNVIDVRQSYLQEVVTKGLKALGHGREAGESIHFSYEMVALTPRSVKFLNQFLRQSIPLTEEDMTRPYIEMAGRRGIGVKADELLDHLSNRAREGIEKRRPDIHEGASATISQQIAAGALRYYMLRFTRNRVVAFDVEDSLAFEGETGPYLQYAAVRSRNIFNKLAEHEGFDRRQAEGIIDEARFASLDPADAVEHWQIVREIARLPEIVEQAVSSLELSLLARYVFAVAQRFSAFYHRHPILHEPDPARRNLRIALNELFLRFMTRSLSLMGVPLPDRM